MAVTLPNGGLSVILPDGVYNPASLPDPSQIAGSPPPMTPAIRLWSAQQIKDAANPIMALFSAPKDRTTSV